MVLPAAGTPSPLSEESIAIGDDAWELLQPLLAPDRAMPRARGRSRTPDRQVFEALLFVVRTGCSWGRLPKEYPAASTVRSRLAEWRQGGLQVALERGLLPSDGLPETVSNWTTLIAEGNVRTQLPDSVGEAQWKELVGSELTNNADPGDLRLVHLRTLETVAELGSFTRAANVLNYAESAVHQQVRRLEAMLRVPLLKYQNRQIRLTEQGEYLLPSIRRVRSAMAELEQAVRSLTESEQVVLGSGRVTGPYSLIGLAARLREELGADIRFDIDSAPKLLEKLIAGTVDVVVTAMIDAYTTPTKLRRSRLVMKVWCSDQWALATANSAPIENRIIFTFSNLLTEHYTDTLDAVMGIVPGANIRSMESIDAIKVATTQGMGMCLVPYCCLADEIRSGQLRIISDLGRAGALPIYLLHRTPGFMNSVTKRMVKLLERNGAQSHTLHSPVGLQSLSTDVVGVNAGDGALALEGGAPIL